ncbi:MAG TPA: response regulator [Candidatus Binataceae bacterium]
MCEIPRWLQARLPHLSIVFIAGYSDVPASVAAMKAGAVDFLEKPVKGAALIDAIERACTRSRNSRAVRSETRYLEGPL